MTARIRKLFRRRFPIVRQYDETDCGPAALLSVLKFWGGDAGLVAVRELAQTDVDGSTMLALLQAAESLGFSASGARGQFEDLRATALPCIAHVVLESGVTHYMVVYRIAGDSVLVGDPARGVYTLSREDFLSLWKTRSVLLLNPTDNIVRSTPPHWVPWILSYFRREEAWLSQSIFLGLIHTALGLLTALFVQQLIDRFIPSRTVAVLIAAGAFLLALQGIRAASGYFRQRFLVELNKRVSTRVATDAINHLFRLPTRFFESHRTGDLTARLTDIGKIQGAVLRALGGTTIDVFVVAGSVILLFTLAPVLAWMAVGTIPIFVILLGLVAQRVQAEQNEVMRSFANVESSYIESISKIEAIRSFNATEFFATLTGTLYQRYQERGAKFGVTHARIVLLTEMAAGALVVAMLTAGGVMVIHDTLTLGQMMAAYVLFGTIMPAAIRIVDSHVSLQEAKVATRRLMDVLLVQPEVGGGSERFVMRQELAIHGGRFKWAKGDPLFENLDLDVQLGRITGLCGASGVGKTTLIKILERKYDLAAGELLIDGVPAPSIDLEEYRSHVTVLPEGAAIINGTIADNVVLGRQIEGPELLRRIQVLGLESLLNRFPAGLMTVVGERGRKLSSGERQVVGLMRALIGSPSVLLIDEGLSTVDGETASGIFSTLSGYSKQHAVLVVSHQLSTLLRADYVYVLGCGRVVEEGAPRDLLGRQTEFSRLLDFRHTLARSA